MNRYFSVILILFFSYVLIGCTQTISRSTVINDTFPSLLPSPEPILSQPTFESIFQLDHSWTATLSSTKVTKVLVTGDVLTARSVNTKTTHTNDFAWPWQKTAETLRTADISFINLETPLVPDCPIKNEGFIFCGDTRNVEGLVFAGIDIANLANNHMGNYGIDGLSSTVEVLNQAGIKTTGLTGPTYIQHNGTTFAFLGYNEVDRQPGVPYPSDELIISEIATAREQADVVIVQFHWGNEYTHQPSTNQKRLAHLAIDSGADLVVGNHPHWWQPLELYKNKFIIYSHGNFIFDQMWSLETRQGIVGVYTFYEDQLIDIEFLPIFIENYGQPRWLESGEKQELLIRFEQASRTHDR